MSVPKLRPVSVAQGDSNTYYRVICKAGRYTITDRPAAKDPGYRFEVTRVRTRRNGDGTQQKTYEIVGHTFELERAKLLVQMHASLGDKEPWELRQRPDSHAWMAASYNLLAAEFDATYGALEGHQDWVVSFVHTTTPEESTWSYLYNDLPDVAFMRAFHHHMQESGEWDVTTFEIESILPPEKVTGHINDMR